MFEHMYVAVQCIAHALLHVFTYVALQLSILFFLLFCLFTFSHFRFGSLHSTMRFRLLLGLIYFCVRHGIYLTTHIVRFCNLYNVHRYYIYMNSNSIPLGIQMHRQTTYFHFQSLQPRVSNLWIKISFGLR